MVFQEGERILCANLGDPRVIMVKGIKVILLSFEQKHDDPEESKRIKENGGEFLQYEEDGEKWRSLSQSSMSRSIEDFISSKLLVIHDPKFSKEKIDRDINLLLSLQMEFVNS